MNSEALTISPLEADYPLGSSVATTVYGIDGRADVVAGTVVDYFRRNAVVAQTEAYGRLVIARSKIA